MKGNLLDLAVAVIIAAAFGKVVSSFVENIIMPPIGMLLGGVDFKDLKYVIQQGSETVQEVAIGYGVFFQNIIDLIIVGFVIFMLVRGYNRATKKQEEEAAPPAQEVLLGEIRDLLKSRN